MAKKPGIYKITNLVNLKCYIGKTERCISKRWNQHKSLLENNKHHNCYLQAAWDKYGEANFAFEVIEYFNPEFNFDINALERFWIEAYNSNEREFGYNLTSGGEGCPASEETRAKISDAHKGKKLSEEHKAKLSVALKGNKRSLGRKLSDETKAKISAFLKGNKNCLGRKHSEESKAKMSVLHKGLKLSEEAKAKISAFHKGKKLSEEIKAKISAANKGNKYCLGRKLSDETKAKISAALKGKNK